MFLSFNNYQYYLQYAKGSLELQNKFNLYFPLILIPTMYIFTKWYGIYGASLVWLFSQLIVFFLWVPFVHHRNYRGLHKQWIFDLIPMFMISLICCLLKYTFDFSIIDFTRIKQFSIIFCYGAFVFFLNVLSIKEVRSNFSRRYS